jgi:hypothetical protein
VAEDEPEEVETTAQPASLVAEETFTEKSGPNNFDSGYFGSQYATQQTQPTQPNDPIDLHQTPKASPPKPQLPQPIEQEDVVMHNSPESAEGRSTEASFQSAKEEQTRNFAANISTESERDKSPLKEATLPALESPSQSRTPKPSSPQKRSPQRPTQQSPPKSVIGRIESGSSYYP